MKENYSLLFEYACIMLTVFFSERRCKITNLKSFLLERVKMMKMLFMYQKLCGKSSGFTEPCSLHSWYHCLLFVFVNNGCTRGRCLVVVCRCVEV